MRWVAPLVLATVACGGDHGADNNPDANDMAASAGGDGSAGRDGSSDTTTAAGGDRSAGGDGSSGTTSTVAFPLVASSDGHYFVDQAGHPFRIQGDSPWDLPTDLSLASIRAFMDARKARGFNTLLIEAREPVTYSTPDWATTDIAPELVSDTLRSQAAPQAPNLVGERHQGEGQIVRAC